MKIGRTGECLALPFAATPQSYDISIIISTNSNTDPIVGTVVLVCFIRGFLIVRGGSFSPEADRLDC
jgi:hypothetical protein